MNWIKLLLGREGRINRKTFLIGLLPIVALFGLLTLYLKFVTGLLPTWADILIPAVVALEALYFTANVSIKRLHDYGHSGHYLWLLFSPLIVAAVFLIQQKFFPLPSYEGAVVIYTLLISLAVVAFLWMLAEMLFRRSDELQNSFGPNPAITNHTTQN